MPKKCIVCEKIAEYGIKGSSEYYCKSCAIEQFQDLDYLMKIKDTEPEITLPGSPERVREEITPDDLEEMSEEE